MMNYSVVIDGFTVASSVVLLLLAILSSLSNPFVRFRRKEDVQEECEGKSLPPLSIILTPHDEADKLEHNLPLILNQKYPAGFQVIVVIEKSEHDTDDILTRLVNEINNKEEGDGSLYVTYIPESSRYLSRKKLAMTIGVKAARTEWILMTEAYTRPLSELWLQTMAQSCTDENSLVIGYGKYDESTSTFKRFERLNMAHYLMREDVHGMAYRTLSHNIMLKKSDFMQQEGFRGNLHLIRGEYDFLVNKYAVEGRTALVISNDAWTIDDKPSRTSWLNKHLFFIASRQWLQRGMAHRLRFNADQILMHLSLWANIAGAICGVLMMNIVLLTVAVFAFLLTVVLRSVFGHKAAKAFDEHLPVLLIYPYELSLIWHNLGYLIRYKSADKLDFTTHKQ